MRGTDYLKDRILVVILHLFCMFFLFGFLRITGYPADSCTLIGGLWLLVAGAFFGVDFWRRRKYFLEMSEILKQMDERFLLGELMPDSARLEDRIYKDMIRLSNKSVIERIHAIEQERKEYREFVESWVHEIKAPITAVALICENHKEELTRRIGIENRKIESFVDMALYYARAGEVYKDYMIRKTELSEVVSEVLAANKYYLIQNSIQAEVHCIHDVYTDKKWIAFIVNQLILNSVKYKKGGGGKLSIRTEECKGGVRLLLKDDGVGIKKEEISRVFEKGFTGSNGRQNGRATGMGLYLCKNLCKKLGIEIAIFSGEGKGTTVVLEFPVGQYYAREGEDDIHEKML